MASRTSRSPDTSPRAGSLRPSTGTGRRCCPGRWCRGCSCLYPPLIAAKLAGLVGALLTMLVLDRRLRTCGIATTARTVTLVGTVPFLLHAAFTWMSPDLLVAAPTLLFLDALLRGRWRSSGRNAAGVGALGGVAYLAKLYALPVVAVLAVTAVVLAARRHGTAVLGPASWLLGGMALVIAAWVVPISVANGAPTIGTAATVDAEVLGSDTAGAPVLNDGLFAPPHVGSVSAWEDPGRLRPAADAPPVRGDLGDFDAARPGPAGSEPSSADTVVDTDGAAAGEVVDEAVGGTEPSATASDGDLAVDGPLDRLADLTSNVPENLERTWDHARHWWPVTLLVLLGAIVAVRARRDPHASRSAAVTGSATVWAGGLQLLIAHPRYLWVAMLSLVPILALPLDRLLRCAPAARDRLAVPLAAAMLLAWVPASLEGLEEQRTIGPGLAELADDLAAAGIEPGDRVASDRRWHYLVGACWHLGCRYHGMPADREDDRAVAGELERHDVDHYLVWRDAAPAWTDPAEAVTVRTPSESVSIHPVGTSGTGARTTEPAP